MMQQQMVEQNQTGCPQPQQQMMLCPVRVVYETQMLMQPGEQMQPNQTIFINPQNTPPWAQNRQVQNQVFYVQQIPNYMQSVPQHMDPQQLYYQQAYQQIQQPMVQNTDMRQYQVNMVPTNMMQANQNIGPNMPTQIVHNERISEANYAQIQANVGPNTTNVNPPQVLKQAVNMQAVQNQIVNQRQVFVNPAQNNQQINVMRPQLITVNPMQQANVQTLQTNVQTFDKNQANNVATQVMPPMYTNTMTNRQIGNTMVQTEARMRKIPPNVNQIQNVRNATPNYVYRPIQPRPQYRNTMPNVNVQNTMPQNPNVMNLQPIPQNMNQDVRKVNEESKNTSRKRKSESPDELNKKVTIVNINTAMPSNPIRITQAPVLNPVKSVEIGVNTSPIHRPKNATITNDAKLNINKNVEVKPKEEAVKPIENTAEKDKEVKTNVDATAEKIRYTVFPQARVRAPKDEFNKVNVNILKDTKNILYTDEKNEFKIESRSLLKEKILSRTETKKEAEEVVSKHIEGDEKTERVKDGKDFVLTHVLDGIVIQESNTAFPIREPTKLLAVGPESPEAIKMDGMLKGSCLELPISDLKLKEDSPKEDKDNPFNNLKTATVKSWTVDELCSHLAKYKWTETTSLLQEHEIDGESLFLVSKTQLLHIGIKEKYADVICEFVKS